jgi:hypothetical protein
LLGSFSLLHFNSEKYGLALLLLQERIFDFIFFLCFII